MGDLDAFRRVRDAMFGIEWAFDEAARRRARLIRKLSEMQPPDAAAEEHRALVEALLHREVADKDATADLEERLSRIVTAARDARDARGRLEASGDDARQHLTRVSEVLDAMDATWTWALDEAGRQAGRLEDRAPEDAVSSVEGYVAALQAVRDAGTDLEGDGLSKARSELDEAHQRLERCLASLSD